MKNFKGDSMNRKIKEQIADYLSEEYVARYLKNFRKRIWPKGLLAEKTIEQTTSAKEIRKILVKTKLLALVSDELRHILGNDTTRRGIFDLFDLFQHKPFNKRLFYILTENLMVNFFQQSITIPNHSMINSSSSSSLCLILPNSNNNSMANLSSLNNILSPSNSTIFTNAQQQQQITQTYNQSPLAGLIKLHLSKSNKVRLEWKLNKKKINENCNDEIVSTNKLKLNLKHSPNLSKQSTLTSANSFINSTSSNLLSSSNNPSNTTLVTFNSNNGTNINTNDKTTASTSNSNNLTRSKSLYNEIQC
jgi:hypothetical protein